jgi:hypothetical protein
VIDKTALNAIKAIMSILRQANVNNV